MRRWIHHHHAIVATLLVVAGLLLVPWLLYLSISLPTTTRARNWSVMWTGIDAAEAVGLIVTGLFFWRHSRYRALPAAVTSAILTLDAWVDVTTSAPRHGRALALVSALGVEIPVAIICFAVAVSALRLPAADVQRGRGPQRMPAETGEISVPSGANSHRTGTD